MKAKQKEVRVRLAPSPTGFLHVGTARTALFNWLFARHHGGKFVLRIEDTDLERSEKRFEKDILDGLKWLGLDWDEGPVRQTDRLDVYEGYLEKLLEIGRAYFCFCTKEELDAERERQQVNGIAPRYNGKCSKLSPEESAQRLAVKAPAVIRFRIPEKVVTFHDIIRGEVSFDGTLIGDVVIAKNVRAPLYNFAVVVDDADMEISHVIRGEEHLANTPRQIFIQEALGFPRPEYAHLPLILNPDRSKMSKRFSATAIQEYKDRGYLPGALINFIALLGWHPKDDREIFPDMEELAKEFELERVQKAGAVFNVEKLDWLNAQYIKKIPARGLVKFLGLKPSEDNLKIIELTRERMKKLSDFKELAGFFLELPDYDPKILVWKKTTKTDTLANLRKAEEILGAAKKSDFTMANLEKVLMPVAEERGRGEFLWPLRAALSGQEASPGPFEILDALGQKESLRRIAIAIERLEIRHEE